MFNNYISSLLDQPIVQNDHMMQPFFPPSMNHGFSHLIHLLDDTAVATTNGQTGLFPPKIPKLGDVLDLLRSITMLQIVC